MTPLDSLAGTAPGENAEARAIALAIEARASGIAAARIAVVAADRRGREALERAANEAGLERRAFALRSVVGFASSIMNASGEQHRSGRLLGDIALRTVVEIALERTATPSYSRHARESARFRDDVARAIGELAALGEDERERLAVAATSSMRLRDLLAIDASVRAMLARTGAFERAGFVARAARALAAPGAPAAACVRDSYDLVIICGIEDYEREHLDFALALATCVRACAAIEEPAAALADTYDRAAGRAVLEALRSRARAFVIEAPASRASAITQVVKARSAADEIAAIADAIEDAIESGIAPERIGVVLRESEPYAPLIARELRARAIPCAPLARESARDDRTIGFVRAALALFADPANAARWAQTLGGPIVRADALEVRLELAQRPPTTFEETLQRLLAIGLDQSSDRAREIAAALSLAYATFCNDQLTGSARILTRDLALRNALRGDDANAIASVAHAGAFIGVLDDTERIVRAIGGDARAATTLARIETRAGDLEREIAREVSGAGVRIVDVRGAKLARFELTIIASAVEGNFPRLSQISPLFSIEDRAALACANVDLRIARDDAAGDAREARMWYVAAERGRARAIITCAVADVEGRATRPSRAIPLAVLPPNDAAPYTRAYDPEASLPQQPSPHLRALLAERVASAFDRATPRPVNSAAPLSVGSVDQWLQCPRRLYFDRLAGIGGEASYAMRFGSALHLVLERFHAEEADFRAVVSGDVARWTARLHGLQDACVAQIEPGLPTLSDYGTFVLHRMLTDYARALYADAKDRPFTVEACERSVDISLGRGRLRGRIDRIDRMIDGTLVLRDYKSGQKHFDLAKALPKIATMLENGERLEGAIPDGFSAQLPLYRLAVPEATRLHVLYFGGEDALRDRIAEDDFRLDSNRDAAIARLGDYVRTRLLEPLLDGARATMPTTSDEKACRVCAHKRICTGAGTVT